MEVDKGKGSDSAIGIGAQALWSGAAHGFLGDVSESDRLLVHSFAGTMVVKELGQTNGSSIKKSFSE